MKTLKHPLLTITVTLSATLILGMVLGGLLVGAVIRDRLDTLRDIRTAEGFTRYAIEKIGPVPADKEAKVYAIINTAGTDVEQMLERGRTGFMQIMNRMEQDLTPILSQEQLERIRAERKTVRDQLDGD